MGHIIKGVKIVKETKGEVNEGGYASWPRILEINTNNGLFKTPTKIVTSQELNSKAYLGSEIDLPGEISLIDKGSLNYDKLNSLMQDNKKVETFIRDSKKHRRRMYHFQLRMLYLYPSVRPTFRINRDGTKEKIPSGIDYFNERENKISQFIDLLKEIADKTEIETVVIPALTHKADLQKKIFDYAINAIDKGTFKEVIPVIDLNEKTTSVERLVDALLKEHVDTGLIKAIGVKNSFADSSTTTRALISNKLVDKEVFVPIFSIDKCTHDRVSGINKQSVFFGDAFAPRFVPGYKNEDQTEYEPSFMDTKTLKVMEGINNGPDSFSSQIINELRAKFGIDYDNIHDDIQRFIENSNARENITKISAIARLHYAIFAQEEILKLRSMIPNNYTKYKLERVLLY